LNHIAARIIAQLLMPLPARFSLPEHPNRPSLWGTTPSGHARMTASNQIASGILAANIASVIATYTLGMTSRLYDS